MIVQTELREFWFSTDEDNTRILYKKEYPSLVVQVKPSGKKDVTGYITDHVLSRIYKRSTNLRRIINYMVNEKFF